MPKLEGIIYKAFGNYFVLRGFAPIGEIAKISKKPESYQRDADNQHKIDIVNYLNDTKAYFPEVTLACRAEDYEGLVTSVGADKDISSSDGQFVKGLRVLSERLPIGRDRARHAYLELDKPTEDEKLTRVDGNHRLEPFSSSLSWWHQFVVIPEDVENESDEENKNGWIKHQAKLFKSEIEGRIIPFTIIISDAQDAISFEAKIFHDINFKQLPLRQEASLRIISDLEVFDEKEKLGEEYPLALELINIVKNKFFSNIHWLKVNNNVNKDYYRTACLRIVQLLLARKSVIQDELNKANKQLIQIAKEFGDTTNHIEQIENKISQTKESIKDIEIRHVSFKDISIYKQNVIELDELYSSLNFNINKKYNLEFSDRHTQASIESLSNYLANCNNIDMIVESLHSLRGIYEEFGCDNYGNIALLVALVYYSILDKTQLRSFVTWAKRNGVNRTIEPGDLSKDSSVNLINMFEQIFQSRKNEIFISMQFGDSQSELIYEKIVRTIENFNNKHKSIHLNARPIRIDRTVESSTFSIQSAILEAIESCSLIIADLSSANINVYHEIGYAMGIAQSNDLLPNMILLYKENTDHNKNNSDTDRFIGFNLRNLSQLRFKDYKQLSDGLLERLEKHYGV